MVVKRATSRLWLENWQMDAITSMLKIATEPMISYILITIITNLFIFIRMMVDVGTLQVEN